MALSTFAAKGLEYAERGSCILYGAGYFTEEEWVKLDALLHKGKYVFTNGPQTPPLNIVDYLDPRIHSTKNDAGAFPQSEADEPLLVFDEFPQNKPREAIVSVPSIDISTEDTVSGNNRVLEAEITPPDSQHERSPTCISQQGEYNTFASSFNEDICTEDEATLPAIIGEPVYINNEQTPEEPDQSVRSISKETRGNELSSTLPAGVTQAQLDEARSFRKSIGGISDWASEVNEETTKHVVTPESPLSASSAIKYKVSACSRRSPSQPQKAQPNLKLSQAEIEHRIGLFTQHFGHAPKAITDYYQPYNPEFNPFWLANPGTNAPVAPRKSNPRSVSFSSAAPGPRVTKTDSSAYLGKSFMATKSFKPLPGDSAKLEIDCGNWIDVIKHVSGNEYRGINKRTGRSGHFNLALIFNSIDATSKIFDGSKTNTKKDDGFSMDALERSNAAEWEDDDDVQSTPTEPQSTSNNGTARQRVGRPRSSRFAALADIDHQSVSESSEMASTVSSQKDRQNGAVVGLQSSKDAMDDNKNCQITEYRPSKSKNSLPNEGIMPRKPTRELLRKPAYEIVVPKTEVCYFWEFGDRCRYLEEQCRDLHEDREFTLQTNVRYGKPNPGPLFDVVHAIPSFLSGESHKSARDPSTMVGKRFTCFFWHQSTCLASDKQCNFLHTYVGSEGILHKEVQVQAYKNRNRKLLVKPKLTEADKIHQASLAAQWATDDSGKIATSELTSGSGSGWVSPVREERSLVNAEERTSLLGALEAGAVESHEEQGYVDEDPFEDSTLRKEPWMW
ncbi:hypothetical protein SBOR_6250 [Sclerotinia borealis F-4128]|uniref:C3H1-type domain-containing protein n=1 Tax=Sclerotinia borealis (strain F-4128) TaxID=1432307 RepID=W9CC33_SCLBF|nr:hypothetical protein SBOR_6250 [Sclerotinia borealis F-4128]